MSDVKMAVPEFVKGCRDGKDFQNVKGEDSELVVEADFQSLEGKKPIRINKSDIDGFAGRDTECPGPCAQPSIEVVNVNNGPKIPKLQKRVITLSVQTDEISVTESPCKKVCRRKKKKSGVPGGYSTSLVDNDKIKRNWIENGTYFNGQFYKLVPVNETEELDSRTLGQASELRMNPVQASSASDECYNYGKPLDLTVNNGPSRSFSPPLDLSLKKLPLGEPTMHMIKDETMERAHFPDERLPAQETDRDDCDSISAEFGNQGDLMDTGQCVRAPSCSKEFSNMSLRGGENSQKHYRDKKQVIIHTEDVMALVLNAQAKKQGASQNLDWGALIQAFFQPAHHRLTCNVKGASENNTELQVIESAEPDAPRPEILSSMPESQTASHATAQATGFMMEAASSTPAAVIRPKAARHARATQAATSFMSMTAIGSPLQGVVAPIPATVAQIKASPAVGATAPMQAREPHARTVATRALAFQKDASPLPQMPNLLALDQIDTNGLLVKNQFETSQSLLKNYYNKKDK